MGMIVDIYSSAAWPRDPFSAIPDNIRQLCVLNIPGPWKPSDDTFPALLIKGPQWGNDPNPVIIPATADGEPLITSRAFGGRFAYTSDSRFNEAVEALTGRNWTGAIPVHDRDMSKEIR